MQNPTYLMLSRHNIYYFRYPLPREQGIKPDYIRMSLGTREPKKALLLAKALYYYVSSMTEKYKMLLMKNNEAKTIVTEYCKKILDKRKHEIEEDVMTTNHLKV